MFESTPMLGGNVARGFAGFAFVVSVASANATTPNVFSDSSIANFGRYQRVSSRPSVSPIQEQMNVRGWEEYLQIIRSTFSLPVSDLALAFDVTRQAIYKWLNGSASPDSEKLARLKRFSDVAIAFNQSEVVAKADYLRLKVFDGSSILELIRANMLVDSQISQLVVEIKSMQIEFKASTAIASKAPATDDWRSDQSISHSFL